MEHHRNQSRYFQTNHPFPTLHYEPWNEQLTSERSAKEGKLIHKGDENNDAEDKSSTIESGNTDESLPTPTWQMKTAFKGKDFTTDIPVGDNIDTNVPYLSRHPLGSHSTGTGSMDGNHSDSDSLDSDSLGRHSFDNHSLDRHSVSSHASDYDSNIKTTCKFEVPRNYAGQQETNGTDSKLDETLGTGYPQNIADFPALLDIDRMHPGKPRYVPKVFFLDIYSLQKLHYPTCDQSMQIMHSLKNI